MSDTATQQTTRDGHPLEDLTAFQRDVLVIVEQMDEPHGLAIKEELETVYPGDIHHGRLYPNLDGLVDKGRLSKGEKDQRTNKYALTARGRRELEADRTWRGVGDDDE